MEPTSAMEAILTGIADVTTAVTSVFSLMTANAYTAFLLSASVIGIAVGIFAMVKSAAR